MKTPDIIVKVLLTVLLLSPAGCGEKIGDDPCMLTKWPQEKEYEIKTAVRVSSSNPLLPGGQSGSQKPEDFESMVASGTIRKVECDDSSPGLVNMGNSYITKGVDFPAPVSEPQSYWIGHVVYVYQFDNDKDHLDINLTVKITMKDGKSYSCTLPYVIDHTKIVQVPGEMYYYILLDINSDSWVRI